MITFNGLTPGDRIKKIGVLGLVSSKDFANSTVLASMYLGPSFSSINAAMAYVILSGLRALNMHRRCIAVLFFHS